MSEYEIWIYKDQTGFAFTPSSLPSNNMSAPAKSTIPAAPSTVESRDWTKATTPELLSGSEVESSVLNAKAKECCCRKQVREERQRQEAEERRAHEEAERKACEEAEVERRVKEEAEHKAHEQVEKERAESQAQAQAELQQRKAAEEAAKQRAVEVATKQKTTAQEVSKKRVREEPEASLVGEVQYILSYFISAFVLLISFCRCVCCTKYRMVCECDPEKPKQWACMKCTGLKEKCEWPEVGGPSLVVDKGKGKVKEKEAATSLRGSEKRKKKKTMTTR